MSTFPIPSINSYQKWVDAGKPESIVSPILVDTYVATYCDGSTQRTINFTVEISTITTSQSVVNGLPVKYINHQLRVTPDVAVVVGETTIIRLARGFRKGQDPSLEDFERDTSQDLNTFVFTNADGTTPRLSNFALLEKRYLVAGNVPFPNTNEDGAVYGIPVVEEFCQTQSPTCTLEITGTTVSGVTTTGENDGVIQINASGITGGSVTYYLNNASPQSSNTFTGLEGGVYRVSVVDGDCFSFLDGVFVDSGRFNSKPFVVYEPSEYVATENPINLQLRTGSNGVATAAKINLKVTSDIEDGDQIIFQLTKPVKYTAIFTAKDFPNKPNFFLTPILRNRSGDQLATNSLSNIATSLAESIENDLILKNYYFVNVVGSVVEISAKQATDQLTLDSRNILFDTTDTGAIELEVINNGVDAFEGSILANYSLYADVYVGSSQTQFGVDLSAVTYNNITTIQLPFTSSNRHNFDVSNIIKTFVTKPKIDLNFQGFTQITSMIRPFYLKYGEIYPLVENENTKKKRQKGQTDYKWALNSALDFEQTNDVSDYFIGGKFLTNSPNPLQVQRNQNNYLYFIIPQNLGTELSCRGNIEYYDGTIQTGITFFNIAVGSGNVAEFRSPNATTAQSVVTNFGGVFALNTSYNALGLASYEASGNTKVKRVVFGVYSNNNLYSEEKTYRYEIDEQPRRFGVVFENKIGGDDTFDFVGIVENSVLRENKIYTVPKEIQVGGKSPEGFKSEATYDTKVTKIITVNSGWIDSDHFNWLIELLSSNNIYSYTEDYQNYLNFESFTYLKSSLDDLFEVEVTFRLTTYENSISI